MILKIVIHPHDKLTFYVMKPRHDGRMLTKVLGQIDSLHIGISFGTPPNDLKCAVLRIIIYEDDFTFITIQPVKFLLSKVHKVCDRFLRIITRHHN
jgi:hypothetical protein